MLLQNSLRDMRYALRQWRKTAGFALVVVLMLVLGIGASTAAFSVINATLLQPLLVSRPDGPSSVRLPRVDHDPPGSANHRDRRRGQRQLLLRFSAASGMWTQLYPAIRS
jgi:hypothetical protein